jgi:hypothetical protein
MLQLGASFLQDFANLFNARRDGVDLAKAAMRVLGNDVGQSGFAGAGRTIKNQRAEPVRLKHSSQELAGTYEVLLTDEFLERPRPHPRRQRLSFFQIGFVDVVKEIDNGYS